ncbi:tetratricopeptide repeat protein [Tumebacillus sp. ITR2]|uniref:Tetratricopeptide repeat protein n=1 Tax=Tumebacillus amylolyticus TaxID=2801339 RepID=A0ABS1JAG5_9BACL|nr:helix-turn-helix domain-containing protein [Tumebacillus amylolyticus]MBL0387279.1 tetratricopeptide repeat protein [Tumebacillus amylolyticus]
METFGQRLRLLRMKKGLTQTQLAEGICTPSMLSQVEGDKARPSYHILGKLAEKLEIPVDELIGNLELNLVLISEYRLAKGILSSGEYSVALPMLKNVIERNNGKLDFFMIRYDYGFCLLQLNMLKEAEEQFEQLLDYANSNSGSPIMAVRVMYMLGQIELKRRRYQIAEHYLSKALDQLRMYEVKDVHLQCSLLLTLGEVQLKAGQTKQSVVTLQLAVPIFNEREDLQGLGSLYMKLAQTSHEAGEYEQATDFAQRATWCYERINDRGEKLVLEVRLAVLQREKGKYDKAVEALRGAVAEFRGMKREEDAGIALTELGRTYLLDGKLDLAEEACQGAKVLLPTVHLYQAWVSRTLAGIAKVRNQQAVAVKYLTQAADCFKLTDCQAEYEETMFELSRLYDEGNDCRNALRAMNEMWLGRRKERRGVVL